MTRKKAPATEKSRGLLVLGFGTLLLLCAGFGGWATMTTISGAIIAPGRIQTALEDQVIQHPEGGIVAAIHVRNGDPVVAGTPLVTLDGTALRAEHQALVMRETELIARQARLEAELDKAEALVFPALLTKRQDDDARTAMRGEREIFDARRASQVEVEKTLVQRRMQMDAQVKGGEAERDATQAQLDIIREEVAVQQDLVARGLAQVSRLNALRREMAALEGKVGSLTAQIGQAGERLIEMESEFQRVRLDQREKSAVELRDIRTEIFGIAEKKVMLEDRLARLEIRSPIAGTVHGLKIHALRSVITPADPIGEIVPTDENVVVSARIEPSHIDEVRIGQEASLHFSALNQRVTPVIFGRVTRISADAFIDQTNGASYYQVEIAPNDGELGRIADLTPTPGMPVEGFISTSDRSPLSYLVKPFADYFNHAMRES